MKYHAYAIPRRPVKLFPELRSQSPIDFNGAQLASQLYGLSASLATQVPLSGQDSGSSWKISVLR